MNQPEEDAVDLDVVADPTASARDRADDAALGVLVRTRLQALELPPSRVDVTATTRRGADLGARARRRTAWAAVGAVAAAAAVVAVVVLGGGHSGPAERGDTDASVATDEGGGTTAVPLRAGVPDLPPDEVTRLEALQDAGYTGATFWGSIASSVTPAACSTTESEIGHIPSAAALDGLATSALQQQCATADVGGARFLYRFYLPQGVSLDDVTFGDATDHGVSWTQTQVDGSADHVATEDAPDSPGGGVTTVVWRQSSASVHRYGPTRTEVTWTEPDAWANQDGTHPVTVRAVVAADPVLAVRTAVGFRNQGGMQVVSSDDGTLLLVPDSDPMGEMQALNHGTLARTPEGCLVLDHGLYGVQLVLWPFGTTWDPTSQVLTVPADRHSTTDHRLGDEVSLGGGESDGQYAKDLVPASCASDKVWIGGSAVVLPGG